MPFVKIRKIVKARIENSFVINRLKLIPAPIVIKNKPNKRPLNGSRSDANECRYLLFESTSPTRKVPRAGDSPTSIIRYAVEIMNKNVVARKISGRPQPEIYFIIGSVKYLLASTIVAMAPAIAIAVIQPGN